MSDRNLADDQVKLVHYVLVSIARGDEHVLDHGTGYEIVTDDMSGEAYVGWRIARYFQQEEHERLHEDDKKHVRVCYQVLCRWPRRALGFENRQLDRLGDIAEAIRERARRRAQAQTPPPPSAPPAGPAAAPSPAKPSPAPPTPAATPSPSRERENQRPPGRRAKRPAPPPREPQPADPVEQEVLRAIAKLGGNPTSGQLLAAVDRPTPEVQQALRRLLDAGRLTTSGRGITARYARRKP
jgi:hypothetical protein